MLCQSCSLKRDECQELCSDVKDHLEGLRNYKTTYIKKEVGLTSVHENEIRESLSQYLDSSGSYTEKYGHLLPVIEQIVNDHGTERQIQVYTLYIHEKMSLSYIAEQLGMKIQSVHEVLHGHGGQGGLVRKIRKHLCKLRMIESPIA